MHTYYDSHLRLCVDTGWGKEGPIRLCVRFTYVAQDDSVAVYTK
jgi:hypothetical protein